jgi:prepilin-type N-terminal cleavage/methylation domain-containing protein
MSKKSFSTKFSLNQEGFTLLEILVVIGMLGVIATFVTPAIGNWRIEKNIEKDFFALVGVIDYLKAKTRVVNGTSILTCSAPNTLTYTISSYAQSGTATKHALYDASILETKTENILSGDTFLECATGTNIIFLNNSKATSWTGEIVYQFSGITDKVNYSAYKVTLNSATAYVQQYKWNKTSESWTELR